MKTDYSQKNNLGILRLCSFAIPSPTFAQSQGVENFKSIG